MTTATKAPAKSRKRQPRTARLLSLPGATCPVLVLTSGKDTTGYRLLSLAAAGRAFRLEKADKGDGPGEAYDVLIDGDRSSCECRGFLRWGHCKHVESLAALLAAGKLPAAPAPPAPAAPQCNDFDDP